MGKPDDAIREMRQRFDRVTERSGVRRVREAYDQAQSETVRSASRAARAIGASQPLTPTTRRALLAHVRTSQIAAARDIAGEVSRAQVQAHTDSLRGLSRFVGAMEGRATVLDEPGAFHAVLDRRRQLMMAGVRTVLARQTVDIVNEVGQHLTDAAQQGASVGQAVRSIESTLDSQFYRVERTVRTQASFAYNSAVHDGIDVLVRHTPDMRVRWVEHVSDATWLPTDAKTAPDSIALHGQVKTVAGIFTMPPDGPPKMVGQQYDFPPNRPNDRAVIMPWRKAWHIPAYEMRAGSRVWLVRR